ncbi:unnamed protein product [Parajaminaea phylloscopi]
MSRSVSRVGAVNGLKQEDLQTRYGRLYERHRKDIGHHFCEPSRRWQGAQSDGESVSEGSVSALEGASPRPHPHKLDARIAPAEWSPAELSAFFPSLARHSRLRPDLISRDLQCSKTAPQVAHYLALLESASLKADWRHQRGKFSTQVLQSRPAREVPAKWIELEEKLATGFDDHVELSLQTATPVARECLNAALFLRARSHIGRMAQKLAERQEDMPTYTFKELAGCFAHNIEADNNERHARGALRSAFAAFAAIHPVPPMYTARRDSTDKAPEAHSEGDATPSGTAKKDKSSAREMKRHEWPIRMILRLCEIGVLRRKVREPVSRQTGSSHQAEQATARGASGEADLPTSLLPICARRGSALLQFKHHGRFVRADQHQRVPISVLTAERLVWVQDIPDSTLATAPDTLRQEILGAREQFAKAHAESCLSILKNLTGAELRWLGDCQGAEADLAARTNTATSGEAKMDPLLPAQVRGRGHKTLTYRGYSLAGMSDKEKNNFKARIRMRQLGHRPKDHAEALDKAEGTTTTPTQPAMSDGIIVPKQNNIDAFRPLLNAMSADDRRRARGRIRKRIKMWGMDRALKAEIADAGLDEASFQRMSAPAAEQSDSGVNDPSSTEEAGAGDKAPDVGSAPMHGDTDPHTSSSGRKYDPRSARFRALGLSRQDVMQQLQNAVGSEVDLSLIDFVSLSRFVEAAQGSLLFDARDRQQECGRPLTINAVALMPMLYSEIKGYLHTVIKSCYTQAKALAKRRRDTKLVVLDATNVRSKLEQLRAPANVRALDEPEALCKEGFTSADSTRHGKALGMTSDPPVDWSRVGRTKSSCIYGIRGRTGSEVTVDLRRALGIPSSSIKRGSDDATDNNVKAGRPRALVPAPVPVALPETRQAKREREEVMLVRSLYGLETRGVPSSASALKRRLPTGFWSVPALKRTTKRKVQEVRDKDLIDSEEEEEEEEDLPNEVIDSDDELDGSDSIASASERSESGGDEGEDTEWDGESSWIVPSESESDMDLTDEGLSDDAESVDQLASDVDGPDSCDRDNLGPVKPLPRRSADYWVRRGRRPPQGFNPPTTRPESFWVRVNRRDAARDESFARQEWRRWFGDIPDPTQRVEGDGDGDGDGEGEGEGGRQGQAALTSRGEQTTRASPSQSEDGSDHRIDGVLVDGDGDLDAAGSRGEDDDGQSGGEEVLSSDVEMLSRDEG